MSETTDREKEIFNQALEMPSAEARNAFLQGACGQDRELRNQIDSLLRAYYSAERFIPEKGPRETIRVMAEPSETPGTVIGRYKLLQRIGEGGMGVVYMAEQTAPFVRKMALKIIKLGMDTRNVIARFEAERQALALMDHPNIAKVLDAGATDNGRPYFVMELVRGVPITEYCDKNKLSTKERLDLFIPVCQAIQHAHQKGIIHRDIKPSNVMVTLHDGKPVPRVIDFGIAKATNQRLTEKTLFTNYAQMIGTPAYMSPEQAEMSGLDVDTRTDVYSLGVLLYELLTGTTPFPAKELLNLGYGEMQRVIAEVEPPKPSTRLSTMEKEERTILATNRGIEFSALAKVFKGDLDWIVMKAIEKDRTHRYETVNGLALDVERHLKTEPVIARPASAAYRIQKLVRRNKLAFAAGAAIAVALLAGATLSAWPGRAGDPCGTIAEQPARTSTGQRARGAAVPGKRNERAAKCRGGPHPRGRTAPPGRSPNLCGRHEPGAASVGGKQPRSRPRSPGPAPSAVGPAGSARLGMALALEPMRKRRLLGTPPRGKKLHLLACRLT
jgi:eukaryotic-like serine/threonine-protein kinase